MFKFLNTTSLVLRFMRRAAHEPVAQPCCQVCCRVQRGTRKAQSLRLVTRSGDEHVISTTRKLLLCELRNCTVHQHSQSSLFVLLNYSAGTPGTMTTEDLPAASTAVLPQVGNLY